MCIQWTFGRIRITSGMPITHIVAKNLWVRTTRATVRWSMLQKRDASITMPLSISTRNGRALTQWRSNSGLTKRLNLANRR